MDAQLDFDPSQYTRLPPYLDSATTDDARAAACRSGGRHLRRLRSSAAPPPSAASGPAAGRLAWPTRWGWPLPRPSVPSTKPPTTAGRRIELRLRGWLQLPPQDSRQRSMPPRSLHGRLFRRGAAALPSWSTGRSGPRPTSRVSWLKQVGSAAAAGSSLSASRLSTELLQHPHRLRADGRRRPQEASSRRRASRPAAPCASGPSRPSWPTRSSSSPCASPAIPQSRAGHPKPSARLTNTARSWPRPSPPKKKTPSPPPRPRPWTLSRVVGRGKAPIVESQRACYA
jgi:hypothetical protein